ncbi:methionine--tRNA ligase subunit beta [Thermoproteus tenax]|uniref:Methionine--tRNA ligase n=1 Tax=Thermoproteus tenax (strain ATCC 35583 / DSM 2078 / JCM 9277 / NBRC 100435 / Kra 1) TaxID=768679 RepID=G4RP23_THETK|nr:methionine--tRNA ligase subunit beta [Thermoproteus tenax]CCC81317.1 putative methionyl-tRNA synthetase N-term subunit, EMAP domain RNA-binding protein [Thermoproteus tenax Kra 1]
MSFITIDDFKKIQLKVGKVVEAARIEGSRKLIRLIVDLGSERRQIVAGLAEVYRPEDLVGKYVVVVANLQPRTIMGYESQGMLLATCEKPTLLTTLEQDDRHVGENVC